MSLDKENKPIEIEVIYPEVLITPDQTYGTAGNQLDANIALRNLNTNSGSTLLLMGA